MSDQSINLLMNYYNEIRDKNIVEKIITIRKECSISIYIMIFSSIFLVIFVGIMTKFKPLWVLSLPIGINLITILIFCLYPQKLYFKFDFIRENLTIKKLSFFSCFKCGTSIYDLNEIIKFQIEKKQVITKKYFSLIIVLKDQREKTLMMGQIICQSDEKINNIASILNLILEKNSRSNNYNI
jgi:hypothetical protein